MQMPTKALSFQRKNNSLSLRCFILAISRPVRYFQGSTWTPCQQFPCSINSQCWTKARGQLSETRCRRSTLLL